MMFLRMHMQKLLSLIFLISLTACSSTKPITSNEFNSGAAINKDEREKVIAENREYNFSLLYNGQKYDGYEIVIGPKPYTLLYVDGHFKYLLPIENAWGDNSLLKDANILPLENGVDELINKLQAQALAQASEPPPVVPANNDSSARETALGVLYLATFIPVLPIALITAPVMIPLAIIETNEEPQFAKKLAATPLNATRKEVQKQWGQPGFVIVSKRKDYEIWTYHVRGQDYRNIKGYIGFANGRVVWKKVGNRNFIADFTTQSYLNKNNVDQVGLFDIGPIPPKKAYY